MISALPKSFSGEDFEQQNLTQAGTLIGSPKYMSPEQCLGTTADKRSDLYAIGCVMFESLVNEPFFDGETPTEVMYRHLNESALSRLEKMANGAIPAELSRILLKSLEKKAELRYQSAQDMLSDLEKISADRIRSAGDKQSLSMAKKSASKAPGWSLGIIVLLTLLLVSMAFLFRTKFTKQADTVQEKNKYSQASALVKQAMQCPDVNKAIQLYKEAVRVADAVHNHRVETEALYLMGLIYQTENRYAEAEASYREAIRKTAHHRNHLDGLTRYSLAVVLMETDRKEQAESVLKEIIRLKQAEKCEIRFHDLLDVRVTLAELLFKKGDSKDALKLLDDNWQFLVERMNECVPDDVDDMLSVVRCLADHHETSLAKQRLTQVVGYLILLTNAYDQPQVIEDRCQTAARLCRNLGMEAQAIKAMSVPGIIEREHSALPNSARPPGGHLNIVLPDEFQKRSKSLPETQH